jgi:hypothetical protein
MGALSRRLNRVRQVAKEQRTGQKVVMRYYARKLEHDNWIREFVVLNGALDPTMRVVSDCADGTEQDWPRFEEEGRSVFVSPDGYLGGPIAWIHRKDLTVEAMVWESEKTWSFAA